MASTSCKEQLMVAYQSRLLQINTSNTPAGHSDPYTVTVGTVTRNYVQLGDIEIGADPTLSVTPSQVEFQGIVGGRQDEFITLTIGGVLVESDADVRPEDSTLHSSLDELETEVRRALYSDPKFGGLAVDTTITQSEYDEGLAHPYAWFVLTVETRTRVRASDPRAVT